MHKKGFVVWDIAIWVYRFLYMILVILMTVFFINVMYTSEINIQGLFLDSPFWMKAELIDGYLTFNLQIEREIGQSEVVRHPDMFGRTFIAVALTYFEQFGPVRGLEGNWETGKDNYNQFKLAIASGMTKEEAAFSTWSGQAFFDLGFNQVKVIDISSMCIETVFKRPSTSPLKASKI